MLALGEISITGKSQRQRNLPPPAPTSSTGTPVTDLQGFHHRPPALHNVRRCSNISCTENFRLKQQMRKSRSPSLCHSHTISVTTHVPTCSRLHSWLRNSFNELRKKLTHFVAGFCPFWHTTLLALNGPGSLKHCQAPNDWLCSYDHADYVAMSM